MSNSKKNRQTVPSAAATAATLATGNAEVEVGLRDTIARNRACAPVPVAAIPEVPHAYQPTSADVRRRVLRLMSGDLKAEALQALQEIAANEATSQRDMGELAPSPAPAKKLISRVQDADRTMAALDHLMQYHREIEDIALSDTVQLLEAAFEEYQHRVGRVPQLAKRYPALARLFEARSATISEGIARSKSKKPVETAADRPATA